jgi:hypothetical protein
VQTLTAQPPIDNGVNIYQVRLPYRKAAKARIRDSFYGLTIGAGIVTTDLVPVSLVSVSIR